MPTLAHLSVYLQKKKKENHPMIMIFFMAFFWCIFDSIMGYMVPLVITADGYSESQLGMIFGFSSIAGMFFDLVLCRYLKNTNYRRMYLFMFAISALFPLLMWKSSTVFIYLLAMAIWGLYYDFFNLGNMSFISHHSEKKAFSANFGALMAFVTLGTVISPLIVGIFLNKGGTALPMFGAWAFLGAAFVFFLIASIVAWKHGPTKKTSIRKIEVTSFKKEISAWKKITRYILPVLFFTLFINVIDAFYWVIGPLLSERLNMNGESGLFLMSYLMPPLIVGWIVGKITRRFGKKRTAFSALLVGSLILISFVFIKNSLVLVAVNFIASFFITMSWPSINGVYADYITERRDLEKEIETVQDTFTNLGYVIGPVLAGFAGQYLGYQESYAFLGVLGVITAVVLLIVTPKKINIK